MKMGKLNDLVFFLGWGLRVIYNFGKIFLQPPLGNFSKEFSYFYFDASPKFLDVRLLSVPLAPSLYLSSPSPLMNDIHLRISLLEDIMALVYNNRA